MGEDQLTCNAWLCNRSPQGKLHCVENSRLDWFLAFGHAQLEEDLGDDYRWSYRVTKVLYSGKSEFQEVDLVDTPTFGKVRLRRCACSG